MDKQSEIWGCYPQLHPEEINLLSQQREAPHGPKHTPWNLEVWPLLGTPSGTGTGWQSHTYEDYLWGFWYPCSHNAGREPQCWDLSPCGQCCSGPGASSRLQGPWKERKFKLIHSKQWLAPTYSEKLKVAQLCLTPCDPMNCNPPGSSVHGILQARTLEWAAVPSFRGSSQPRGQTQVSYIAGRGFFNIRLPGLWAYEQKTRPPSPWSCHST